MPWASLVSNASAAPPLARLRRYRRSRASTGAIDLSRMEPSPELLPHAELRRCMDHVLRTRKARALAYAPPEGVDVLREQIAQRLVADGMPARAEDVLVTTGSQQAIDLVARALIDPGDRFLADETTYAGALNLLSMCGAQLVGVPSDRHGPSLDWLERSITSRVKGLYLMPNHHNPTSRCIPTRRREQLVAWSQRHSVPLIEDDYAADLVLDDDAPRPPFMRTLDPDVIYVSTFSKKLIPALRVGFVVAPTTLRPTLASLKHATDLGNSALLQYTLAEFLERGYLRKHFVHVLPVYRERRDALHATLRKHLPAEISWTLPGRGVVLWLELPASLDPERVYESAARAGVLVSPSALHTTSGPAATGLRLNFCYEPTDRLVEAAKRLSRVIHELLKQRPEARKEAPAVHGV
jgi:DNA-binding transcriptional MocR family regulator